MVRKYKWSNIIVSDGLGSKSHSDHGSKIACLAIFEAVKSYHNNPDANIIDIFWLINDNWIVKIALFTCSECSVTSLFAMQNGIVVTLGRLGDGMIVVFEGVEVKPLFLVIISNVVSGLDFCSDVLGQRRLLNRLWGCLR